MPETDWGQLYRDNVGAVTALAEHLTTEELSLRVPATPDWTVHDLLAHLAGETTDLLNGRMDDAPSAAWTARHVEAMWHPVLDASAPRLVGEHTEHVAEVPAYELFRALFSRRSRGQMSGWGTPLDPATLDGLCMFGPRDDDQPVPA